jgi:methionyl aminopeptidase
MPSLWRTLRRGVANLPGNPFGMVKLKSQREIGLLRESAQLVSRALAEVGRHVEPGVTPQELDGVAETFIRDHGAEPAFLGHEAGADTDPFPATLCTSVNDAVVHGIPGDVPLREGDLLSVDCGVFLNRYVGDSAYTFAVGELAEEDRRLCQVTFDGMHEGIAEARDGQRTGDVGAAVEAHCTGYGIVEALCGHGVGRELWEKPQVPNYGTPGEGTALREGLVVCIEPMINRGTAEVTTDDDAWTVRTADGERSAHYEHMVAVRPEGGKPEILSTFEPIERAVGTAPYQRDQHAAMA